MDSTATVAEKSDNLLESKTFRLILLRQSRIRREGSLAAALAQSMALAVIGTAGAYPSWVLVQDETRQIVLGAAWAIAQIDPAPDTPLLGPAGAPLMLAIAFCCLFSVLSGSLALTMDFLGRRQCRSLAPLFHGLTAILTACAAALGSCLLALVRGRSHMEAEDKLSTSPGQSLFLAFLACVLASTATGLSCMSPALVQPARSSWDFGRPGVTSFFQSSVPTESDYSTESSVTTVSWQDEARRHRESASTVGGRSGKVHWYDKKSRVDPDAHRTTEDHSSQRQEQLPVPPPEEGQESKPQERKSSVQRFWESGRLLVGNLGNALQRSAAEPAETLEGGNLDREQQEVETEREAPFEGQAPIANQNTIAMQESLHRLQEAGATLARDRLEGAGSQHFPHKL